MAKFNVTTPSAATEVDAATTHVVDQLQRQAPESPAPAPEGAAVDLPVDDPLMQAIASDGVDVSSLVGEAVEQGQQEALYGEPAQEPGLTPEQEQQREIERVEPLSKRIAQAPNYSMAAGSPIKAQMERAERVNKLLEYDASGETENVTLFAAKDGREALAQDIDPYRDTGEYKIANPISVLANTQSFDAGTVDLQTGQTKIDPVFGNIASIVYEKYASNAQGIVDGVDLDQDLFTEEGEVEPSPDLTKTKAMGNARLGNAIWTEYMREKATRDQLPSDTYVLQRTPPKKEDLEYVGAMIKEIYSKANPDVVREFVDPDSGQVSFQPTQLGLQMMRKSDEAANRPFDGNEIAPLVAPSRDRAGQPEFEAARRVRKETGTKAKQPAHKNLDVMNEARSNLNKMPLKIDTRGSSMVYQNGLAGINEAMQYYQEAAQLIDQEKAGNRPYWNGPAGDSGFLSNLVGIGSDKLNSLLGEKARLQALVTIAAEEVESVRAQGKPIDSAQAKFDQAQAAFAEYEPLNILKSEINKQIETMNTIARYSGQLNHLTFSIQMLTGRMNAQQNKFNPQNNKLVRFAARVSDKPVHIDPNRSGWAENNFKEVMAVYFLNGKGMHPQERIKVFNEAVAAGDINRLVTWGNELNNALITPDQATQSADIARQIEVRDRTQGVINIPPALQQVTAPEYSEELMEFLNQHDAEERLYYMEALMDLANYDAGAPFYTTFEPEMDGITHGITSNGAALGIENTMLRGGVIHIGDKKQMVENGMLPGDLRVQMKEQMENDLDALAVERGGENALQFAEVARLAIGDRANYLKKAPMTFVYGQDLANLDQHVQTTMFTGKNAPQIRKYMEDQGLDVQQVQDFLHELLVQTLINTLTPQAIAVSRQLRANNTLAILSGRPMYYDNAMGFRNWIGGKQDTGVRDKSELRFNRPGEKATSKPIYHYNEEIHGAADRPRAGGRVQVGGVGHGQVIPAVTQAYDGNMIAKTASGQAHKKMTEQAAARGHSHAWLPIFDAGKTNLANVDLLRTQMNQQWWNGIKNKSFVNEIMGPDGWFDTVYKETKADLQSKNAPINILEGQYRGVGALLFDTKARKRIIQSTFSVSETNQLLGKDKDFVKKVDQKIESELEKAGIKLDETHDTLLPHEVLKVIDVFVNTLGIRSENAKLARSIENQRAKAFAKVNERRITQVDLG